MRQAVLSGDYDPTRKAVLFAELKEGEIAAQIILAEPTAFRGESYPTLLPLARSLEQGQPLAGSIVHRALLVVDPEPCLVQSLPASGPLPAPLGQAG